LRRTKIVTGHNLAGFTGIIKNSHAESARFEARYKARLIHPKTVSSQTGFRHPFNTLTPVSGRDLSGDFCAFGLGCMPIGQIALTAARHVINPETWMPYPSL
jgi:hypothetical protein